nr:hypothetical protein [Tanacetum cinerariifolium]
MEKKISKVHSLLIEFEKSIKRNRQPIVGASSTPQVMAIQGGRVQKYKPQGKAKGKGKGKGPQNSYPTKPKKPQPYKKERPAKDGQCHHCKEEGIGKGIVYDTGCVTHICNTKKGLRGAKKLKRGRLYLYVGNSVRAKVEAIGSFDLVLPNGLIIVLDNCLYAPSITRGVVSVSRLVDKVWGYEAHVKRHTSDKLQQRSVKCIFVGYPKETMGYYFYYPPENKIVVERYANFLEKDFILQKESERIIELEYEDILASENTREHLIEEEILALIVSQEEDVIPVRRSVRTHKAPEEYGHG